MTEFLLPLKIRKSNATTERNCASGDQILIPGSRSFADPVPLSPPYAFLSDFYTVLSNKAIQNNNNTLKTSTFNRVHKWHSGFSKQQDVTHSKMCT